MKISCLTVYKIEYNTHTHTHTHTQRKRKSMEFFISILKIGFDVGAELKPFHLSQWLHLVTKKS